MSTPPDQQLPERDFIQDNAPKSSFPFWLWGILFTIFVALAWGSGSWYVQKMGTQYSDSPFLQVTNRDFSLFLWQFPEYMRVNSKQKLGYLPGFQYTDKVTLNLDMAEDYVIAPPTIVFLYHVWDRLLKSEFIERAIPIAEFQEFLGYAEEWQPKNWPNAPKGYVKFIENVSNADTQDLRTLPPTILPLDVRRAFQGWKNYFKDGEAINQVEPTYAEMQVFLQSLPHYARNYWRNIEMSSYPKYLETLTLGKFKPADRIPNDDLAPFLKVAFYNFQHR